MVKHAIGEKVIGTDSKFDAENESEVEKIFRGPLVALVGGTKF